MRVPPRPSLFVPRRRWMSVLVAGLAGTVLALGPPAEAPAGAAASDTNQVTPVRNVAQAVIPIADISPRGTGGQFAWGVHLEDGTDWGYSPCSNGGDSAFSACPAGPFGYYRADHWTASSVSEVSPNLVIPNSTGPTNHGWANKAKGARIEIYPYGPGGTSYDPWTQDTGGVHINAFGINGAGVGPNLGVINLPTKGQANAGRLGGAIVSRDPIATKRLIVDAFQEHSIYDNHPYSTTSTGFPEGGFASVGSKGSAYTTGWVFNGLYHLFLTDTKSTVSTADDVKIQVMVVIQGDTTRAIDLDAPCFGFDECAYDSPNPYSPVLPVGGFHPVTPERIMDTRDGTGRPFNAAGPVSEGDGSSPGEPNNITRAFNQWNHEATVVGVGGVPATGVSAVVLNVTVTGPTAANSFLSVYPKPPRTFVYDDQSSFGASTVPLASNLNYVAGQTVPNLVVARVGVGGKVRLKSNSGSAHVIFDVVGWFDTGAVTGDAFTGVTPTRIMDTRADSTVGPYSTPFAGAAKDRALDVTGGVVPDDATAVVVNVTGLRASETTHLTVYPDGEPRPIVSNLNIGFGHVVPNLVMVKVGTGGNIRVFNNSGSADAIVDVVGYYRAGAGGKFRATSQPTRILDTRSGVGTAVGPVAAGPGGVRTLLVGGANGVPANATAVLMNVTVTSPTTPSHVTVFPDGVAMPVASNLNFSAGQTVPNLVMVKLGTGGRLKVFNNAGNVDVIADVAGYLV